MIVIFGSKLKENLGVTIYQWNHLSILGEDQSKMADRGSVALLYALLL